MNLAYLAEDTDPSARLHTVLAQADVLVARGHRVRIVTTGLPLTWRPSRAEWVYVDDFREYDASGDEFVIGATDDVTRIGVIVGEELFRAHGRRENDLPRVLLSGSDVSDGYGAVTHARWFHQKLDLIRVSPWAPSREEPLDTVQEFHVALTTAEMTRLVHSCDILVAPEEGFSLTAPQAMAAGVACVLTSTPWHRSFDERHDYALFAPQDNAVELGERLIELLSDPALRARLVTRGREVAEQWRSEHVAERLEAFFRR
ncbi:MAG TPA: glycosyltransferase [Thermoanaerobaculia bacterium]|nr:glycosyltransferase [Thermoanaerobaculia bacterium]